MIHKESMDGGQEFIIVRKKNVLCDAVILVHVPYHLLIGDMVNVVAWFDPPARVDLEILWYW